MIFMTEQRKMQLQLSEEQLQAITGGCKLCDADLIKAANSEARATSLSQRSQQVLKDGQHEVARMIGLASNAASLQAKRYRDKVTARHPASSSTSASTSGSK
jgi:hypothetical protein